MTTINEINAAYSKDYCDFLEATYGANMLSEGGAEAIDNMFAGMDLANKKLLEIGSGLGGTAIHLASRHDCHITGLEINPGMTREAQTRIPSSLSEKIAFTCYLTPNLPFDDNHFDIVYSKGVLTHVEDKAPLFKEIYRVLKTDGYFIVDDWLSPTSGQWGPLVTRMCETENLALYANTESEYKALLHTAGFLGINMRSENINYERYNREIVSHLTDGTISQTFKAQFGETDYQLAVKNYGLITDAIKNDELLIRWFKAQKSINRN